MQRRCRLGDLRRVGSQLNNVSLQSRPDPRLESVGGDHIDRSTHQERKRRLQLTESKEAGAGVEIDQEIDVAARGVVAARDASDNADVACAELAREVQDLLTVLPESVADPRSRQASRRVLDGPEIDRQVMTSRFDQLDQCDE